MTDTVDFKSRSAGNEWVYSLGASDDGNSTQSVVCFEKEKALSGIILFGQWEIDSFFRLAIQVQARLPEMEDGAKSISVTTSRNLGATKRFRAEKEHNRDLWKVVFTCVQPSQFWKTWGGTYSGSPRNFNFYRPLSQVKALIDALVEIPEQEADSGGTIISSKCWVEKADLSKLEPLPRQIVESAREGIKDIVERPVNAHHRRPFRQPRW